MSTGKSQRKATTKAPAPSPTEAAEAKSEAAPVAEAAPESSPNATEPTPEALQEPPAAEDELPEGVPPVMPSERMIGDLRKELSDKFPHAEFKEMLEQMQMQLHRMPKHTRDSPKRKVWFHLEVPVETVAYIEAWMPHLWPSRRSQN